MTDVKVIKVHIEIGEQLAEVINNVLKVATNQCISPGDELRKAFNLDFSKIIESNSKIEKDKYEINDIKIYDGLNEKNS